MIYFVNGIVWNLNHIALTFKYENTPKVFELDKYLHIRGPYTTAAQLGAYLGTISHPAFVTVYDPSYPLEEGYFFVRERATKINNYTIQSFSLKDRMSIVSIRLNMDMNLRDLSGAPTNVFAFATEDYLYIIMNNQATITDFDNTLMALNSQSFINTPYPIVNISRTSNYSIFTTQFYNPEWLGEEKQYPDSTFLDVRSYYYYEIDFKDYAFELIKGMQNILQVPVKHQSESVNLPKETIAYVLYTIEYQDKFLHAIYRKLGPFDTHQYCAGKINFTFYTSDVPMYRGFVNDYNWFEKLTNNLTIVNVQKTGMTAPYVGTVKWSVDEPDWNIETVLTQVSSDRNYYQYQYNFHAEIWYFYVRKKRASVTIDNIYAILTEPANRSCENLRQFVSQVNWAILGNNVHANIPSGLPHRIISPPLHL